MSDLPDKPLPKTFDATAWTGNVDEQQMPQPTPRSLQDWQQYQTLQLVVWVGLFILLMAVCGIARLFGLL